MGGRSVFFDSLKFVPMCFRHHLFDNLLILHSFPDGVLTRHSGIIRDLKAGAIGIQGFSQDEFHRSLQISVIESRSIK